MTGVADALGYRHHAPNGAQRAVRRFASTRPGAWMFSKTARHIDRVFARFRPGHTAPEVLAGLNCVWVTTTGARSGQPRTSALVGVPIDDGLALVGTNFGGTATPNWYYNLRAHPEADVRYDDQVVATRAREATDAERERIFAAAQAIYSGYGAYRSRISGREIPVMVLETSH